MFKLVFSKLAVNFFSLPHFFQLVKNFFRFFSKFFEL